MYKRQREDKEGQLKEEPSEIQQVLQHLTTLTEQMARKEDVAALHVGQGGLKFDLAESKEELRREIEQATKPLSSETKKLRKEVRSPVAAICENQYLCPNPVVRPGAEVSLGGVRSPNGDGSRACAVCSYSSVTGSRPALGTCRTCARYFRRFQQLRRAVFDLTRC